MAAWVESACPISHRVFALMASFTAFASLVGRQYNRVYSSSILYLS
jgi:hypothetical protein